MKLIRTEEAVGHVRCHDLTQIIKDQYKDARFRKGHVVAPEDIPVLLGMGKEHLYVWEMTPGTVSYTHLDVYKRQIPTCAVFHRSRQVQNRLQHTAANGQGLVAGGIAVLHLAAGVDVPGLHPFVHRGDVYKRQRETSRFRMGYLSFISYLSLSYGMPREKSGQN